MRHAFFLRRGLLAAVLLLATVLRGAESGSALVLRDGDRVALIGDTFAEREQYSGWIETMLTARFGNQSVVFRNLGWSADTPAGDSRFGLSLMQAGHEPATEGWTQLSRQIGELKPTVAFIGYGMAASFAGEAGVERFKADYRRLLDTLAEAVPDVRLVLLSPIPHEALGAPWPDPAARNRTLSVYAAAIAELAAERRAGFVPLFSRLQGAGPGARLTDNGIHLSADGYRRVAEEIEDSLFGPSPGSAWRSSVHTEALRAAIVRKNEWYFHRSRPANMAYIFGFRRHEQGRNAAEVLQFDEYVAAEEARIAALRSLRPVEVLPAPRPARLAPAPVTPQPRPSFEVAEGFEVTLWAENPLLHKPVQMNFDARGRLWVASSAMYPQIEPGQEPVDQIIVLEDSAGLGRADKATVFAEGLLIPTGLEPGDGGVYVAQSTELLHFADTNGDGRADVRRTVLSGFGTEDTHHNLHTLRWGPDGRLHLSQSVYTRTDTETPHGVVRLKAGGVFRLDPRDQRMEILFRGFVNTWGHQFDAYGRSFLTDGAGNSGVAWGVDGATYRTLAPARRVLQSVSPGDYPKFCGLEIIRSAHFPDDWQGDVITADFRANRIVRFKLSEQGSGFVTRQMPDVLRTTTDSFRPIDVRLGPDGALYVADWSNPIIQHGEVDFRDPRRDKVHGRIWRIAAKERPLLPVVDFTTLTNAELFARLSSPNGYDQERATRVLVERGAAKVQADLGAWTASLAPGDAAARLRALWLHQAFGAAPEALVDTLLTSTDADARAAAVRALGAQVPLARLAVLVDDAHPRVRLEAVRALGRHASAEAAALALGVLARPMDPFIDYALWLTINELAGPWVAAVQSGAWSPDGREAQLEFALKSIEPALASTILGGILAQRGLPRDGSGPWIDLVGAAGGPDELRRMLDAVKAGDLVAEAVPRALRALADAARLRKVRPAGSADDLMPVLTSATGAARTAAFQVAGAWQFAPALPVLVRAAGDPASAAAERQAAFTALRDIGGADAIAAARDLGANGATPAIRRDAVVVLAALDLAHAVPDLLRVLRETGDEAQAQALWRELLAVRSVGARLTEALQTETLPPAVAQAGLRPAREGNRHAALVPLLLQQAGMSLSAAELSPEELRTLAREALLKGDAMRGERIYRRTELACVACHAIGGAGGRLGPDLTSIGASAPPDYLVEAMLYPNAKIKEGYHAVAITTRSGSELSGMVVAESATEIRLRDAANQEVSVAVNDIARRTSVGSLMPAGLLDGLVPEERLDLIKFLTQLGKPGEFDASRGGVARAWRMYYVTSRNQHLGVSRVTQGDATLTDWQPIVALVSGLLPADEIARNVPGHGRNRPQFAAVDFDAPRAGEVTLALEGRITGLWLNGEPVPVAPRVAVAVSAGRHVLVLQLDEREPVDVRVTSPDVTFVAP